MSLLSMLEPGLVFPDNEGKFDQTKKCPKCHGVRAAKLNCARCGGTGKQREPGGQHQTRCKKISTLSPQDVIGYAQGLPDRKWKALYWKLYQDAGALRDVQSHLIEHATQLARKQDWTYLESAKAPRIERLCLLACLEMEEPAKYDTMPKRAKVMEIDARSFERTWWLRYMEVQGEVVWWAIDAETTIYRRHRELAQV